MWTFRKSEDCAAVRARLLDMYGATEDGLLNSVQRRTVTETIRKYVCDRATSSTGADYFAALSDIVVPAPANPAQDIFLRNVCGLIPSARNEMIRINRAPGTGIEEIGASALAAAHAYLTQWREYGESFPIPIVTGFINGRIMRAAEFVYGAHSPEFKQVQRKSEQSAVGSNSGFGTYSSAKRHEPLPRGEAKTRLEEMIGLKAVKTQFRQFSAVLEVNAREGRTTTQGLNLVFAGNPGSGKTTVARLVGSRLRDLGLLSSGHVIEAYRSDLVGSYIGSTEPLTQATIASAIGGVLFVDEAHTLVRDGAVGNDFGCDSLRQLMIAMENNRGDIAIVFATYSSEVPKLYAQDPGFKRRVSKVIEFEDYSDAELTEILQGMAKECNLEFSDGLDRHVAASVGRNRGRPDYGNAGTLRQAFENGISLRATRLCEREDTLNNIWTSSLPLLEYGDFGLDHDGFGDVLHDPIRGAVAANLGLIRHEPMPRNQAMSMLNKMVGLDGVKKQMREFAAVVKLDAQEGHPSQQGYNLLLTGSPGTGKTTIARLLGSILRDLGVLDSGHMVEVNRGTLVAGFIGQTANHTQRAVQAAMNGVLFVDEAHTFANGGDNDFGREAIQQIMLAMETHRGKIAVVFATYASKVLSLTAIDPGFSRRISQVIKFEDYSDLELTKLLQELAKAREIPLAQSLAKRVGVFIGKSRGNPNYGNAGTVRQVFEQAKKARALRLIELREQSGERRLPEVAPPFQDEDFGLTRAFLENRGRSEP